MKKKTIYFKPGKITLYNKNKDKFFRGSLVLTTSMKTNLLKDDLKREELLGRVFEEALVSNLNLIQASVLTDPVFEDPVVESSNLSMNFEEQQEKSETENNDRESDLIKKNPKVPEFKNKKTKDTQVKKFIKEYWDLLDFPALFKFILHQANDSGVKAFQKAKNASAGINTNDLVVKLLYSDNPQPKISLPKFETSGFLSKGLMKNLAVVCLGISFLSFIGALVPVTVAKYNSIKMQSQIQKYEEEVQRQKQENAAMLRQYEIDPNKEQLIPKEFKLSIPKIGLDSDISPSVDLDDEQVYKEVLLSTGVAHAKGSYFPGQPGSVFLFAHSTDTVFNIAQFNAKFFALGELQNGDEIKVFYQGREHTYKVANKVIIEPEEVDLIRNAGNSLILMTCTPPGTDWQRLIIFADEQQTSASIL